MNSSKKPEQGIVVVSSPVDLLWARGCLESIRYFMPNAPVTLLYDGKITTEVTDMLKVYAANLLSSQNTQNLWLRHFSYAWGLTKMVAFWESPYERTLILDPDTMVWGNLLDELATFDTGIVVDDNKVETFTPELLNEMYFNLDFVEKEYPDFKWQGTQFVNTGVLYTKRNFMPLPEYQKLFTKVGKIFKLGEMGLLNFMLFYGAQRGLLDMKVHEMQKQILHTPKSELEENFSVAKASQPIEKAFVLHWCGKGKPRVGGDVFHEPMTKFRLDHRRRMNLDPSESALAVEEKLNDGNYPAVFAYSHRRMKIRKTLMRTCGPLLMSLR